jgi:hypothetical protein
MKQFFKKLSALLKLQPADDREWQYRDGSDMIQGPICTRALLEQLSNRSLTLETNIRIAGELNWQHAARHPDLREKLWSTRRT